MKGSNITLQQITVEVRAGAEAALDGQSDFEVATQHFFLEQPAQTHLQRLGSGRHAHVQIKKAMIDALERKVPGKKIADAVAGPGKAGH